MREKQIAWLEAHHIAAAEAYFAPRPEQDTPLGRKTFEAGFVRAFEIPAPEGSGVVHATARDLARALAAKDNPPRGLPGTVDAAVLQMGLVCLGDRTLRLRLPNNRTLRVSLEE